MKAYKYLMAQFTFYDRTGICKLLEEQAEKGWLLDKVTNHAWRLRRTEPRKIHYAVTYFPKASAYDPGPSEQQRELYEFCAHSGWILAGTTAQLQVFYNTAEDPVPIETDPLLELENIHRSAKKNYLPAYFMLLVLALFQIAMQISQLMTSPLTYLSAETTLFNWLCQGALLLMCSIELIGYFSWYFKAKKAAENGEFVQTRGFRKMELFLLFLVVAALIWLLCSMKPRMAVVMGITLVLLFAVILSVTGLQTWMKRKGVSTGTNRIVTWVLTFALTIAIVALIFPVTNAIMHLPVWKETRQVRQFEWNGHSFDIYKDNIPLRVEDLTEATSPDYSYEAHEQSSPFLKKGDYSQRIWFSTEFPEMSYIVYTTKIPAIYDLCVREATSPSDYPAGEDEQGNLFYDTYELQDAAPWKAEKVYRRYAGREPYNHYVLCYENCVVILKPSWELTAKQMGVIGAVFNQENEHKFEK